MFHLPEGCQSGPETISFQGDYWQIFWGEVDGLGLVYSSRVDVIDHLVQLYRATQHSDVTNVFVRLPDDCCNMLKRNFLEGQLGLMYKTQLYQPPQDTDQWRSYMW